MNDYNRGALPDPCLRLDYGFGEQWASVELGDGTGYVRLADYEKAVAENAKLREICVDMLTCINAYKARKSICWECEHHRAFDELRSVCFLGSDARRLGIEVDE